MSSWVGSWHVLCNEAHGAFLQRPDRVAVGVAFDATVERVRRRVVDAADLEGLGVDPGTVTVAVGKERGPVGDDGVERRRRRQPSRERVHRPASAD